MSSPRIDRKFLEGIFTRMDDALDAEGAETGMFEIPAGGRRYQALALLVKQKRLAKTALIPSDILISAESDLAPQTRA